MVQNVFRGGGNEGLYLPITLSEPGTYKVKWFYENYTIPDQVTFRYNGNVLFNSGFVGGTGSGTFTIKVPEAGGKFAAVMATNNPQTRWYFTLEFDDGPQTPVANPDRARVGKDDVINGLVGPAKKINVAANDTDDEALDLASITITSAPKRGTATANADGTITYNASKPGRDSFFYTIKDKDGNVSDPAKVTILGDCPDPAPLVVGGFLHHRTESFVCVGQDYHPIGRQDGLENLLWVDTNPQGAAMSGQILVFEDRVEIKNALVQPLRAFGAGPYPLFYGDVTLPATTAAPGTSDIIVTSGPINVTSTAEAHRFYFVGLWFQPDKLQLRTHELDVAGNFVLPEALGGANIELPILNGLVFKESGVSLGGGKIAFPAEFKFNLFGLIGVKAAGASIEYQAVEDLLKITGKFDLTSSIMKPDHTVTKYGEGMGISLDFLGTVLEPNFIQVKNGVADLRGVFKLTNLVAEGGWGISEASLFLETTNGSALKAGIGGKLILPFSRAKEFNAQTGTTDDGAKVTVGGEIVVGFNSAVAGEWGVTKATAFGENLDIPLPITGDVVFLENISATVGGWAIYDPLPLSLGGSMLFTLGKTTTKINWELPKFFGTLEGTKLEGNVLNLFIDGTVAVDKTNGALTVDAGGYISVINENILKLSGRVNGNFDTGGVKVSGGVTGFAGILNGTGDGTFFFSDRPGFLGNFTGSLTIPKLKAFGKFAGQNLANANAMAQLLEDGYNGNDFAQAWGKVSALTYGGQKLFDMTAGFKMLFKNGLFSAPDVALILGAKDVLKAGSWDTYAGQDALVMSASWENEINDHVGVLVQWRNLATGEERFFTEDEFDANGIAVIDQLTGAFGKTVVVTDPIEGRWDLILPTDDPAFDFGAIDIEGYDPIPDPVLEFTGAGQGGDGDISFDFRADFLEDGARVAFYWDDNAEGFDGTLIADDIVISGDVQTYSWQPSGMFDREGDGHYSIYAVITQPDGFPVLGYHWAEFSFPTAADLVVERQDFPIAVPPGGYFSYVLTLRNDGSGLATRAQLSELIDGAVIDDVYVIQGDATIHRSDIGGGFVVQANSALYQGDAITVYVNAHADPTRYHGTLGQDQFGNDLYEVFGISADATAWTASREANFGNDRAYGVADYRVPEVVSSGADVRVERDFLTDLSGPIGSVRYDLVVTNQGPETATGIVLTEAVTGGTISNYFARPIGGGFNTVKYDGQSVQVKVPDLPPGAKYVVPMGFRAASTADLTLTAQTTHGQADIDHHNDFAIDHLNTTELGDEPGNVDIALRIGSVTEGAGGLVLLQLQLVGEGEFLNLATDIQVKLSPGAGLTLLSTDAAAAAGAPIDVSTPTYDTATGVWALNGAIQGNGQVRTLNLTLQKDSPAGGVFKAELIGLREHDLDSTPGNNVPTEDDTVITTIGTPNRAPVLSSLIPDVTVGEGQAIDFVIPTTSFIDPDGDAIRYSISAPATGTPGGEGSFFGNYSNPGLPSWLRFDADTGRLSGTAQSNQSDQAFTILVTATDNRGGTTTDTFRLAVNDVRTAPAPNKAYPDVVAFVGVPIYYQLPSNVPYDPNLAYFTDGDLYRYKPGTYEYNHFSYDLFDAATVPAFLGYGGGGFFGTPQAEHVGTYDLTVLYRNQYYDGEQLDGAQVMRLTVVPIEPPVPGTPINTLTGTENQPFSFVVPDDAFSDPNGDPLGYWWTGLPAWLTYDVETGALRGTPIQGAEGAFNAVLHASDGKLGVAQQTVHFVFTNINDAPQAIQDFYSLLPGSTVSANVAVNDTDKDNDALSFALARDVQHGVLAFNADGSFTYTPEAGFAGADSFTYIANDGALDSVATTVALYMQGPPEAVVDSYTARMNIADGYLSPGWGNRILSVDADHGVLANDPRAPTAVVQQAELATGPAHGTLTLFNDGSFTYRADNEFFGTDSFSYRPWDGMIFGEAVTVGITVPFENRPAFAQFDGLNGFNNPASVEHPFTFTAAQLLANDNARDGDTLTAVLLTRPKHGTLVENGDGSFTYTPDTGFRGTDFFLYNPHDPYGPGSNNAGASIQVTAPDTFIDARDDFYATATGATLVVNAPGVIRNDADPDTSQLWAGDGNGLYYDNVFLVDQPLHGTVNYFSTSGSFSYTPNAGFTGTDSFTYRSAEYNRPLGDGEANPDRATVTIFVGTPDTAAAPVAVADSYAAVEDVILKVDVEHGLLANDIAAAGRTMVAELVSQAQLGRVFLSPYGNFRYEPATNNFDGSGLNRNGTDAFTYRVWDGGKASAAVTVVLNIAPVSDLPRAPDLYDYRSQSYSPAAQGSVTAYGAGDPDDDGGVSAVNGSAANVGQFVQGLYGTFFLGANGSYQWRPDVSLEAVRALKPGEFLEDLFTYTWTNPAGSATGTYRGRIQGIDDFSVGVADAYATTPNTPLIVDAIQGVLVNDIDIDGIVGGARLVSGTANGELGFNGSGAFTYAPRLGFVGTDTFSYMPTTANGNDAATQVSITVQPLVANTAPVALADSYAMLGAGPLVVGSAAGVLANDTDAQNDPFVAVLVSGAANGTVTLNQDGSFSYAANAGFSGQDSFTYQANDGQALSAPTAVSISVPVNRAPVANDAALAVVEDTALAGNLVNFATDADADPLAFTLVLNAAHGLVRLNADGSFTYTPDADYFGTDSFTFRATDGRDADSGRIDITVTPVNDRPVASPISYVMQEDGVLVVQPPGPLANATDADGDALAFVLVTPPTVGSFSANATGGFTFTPALNFFGAVTFQYAASDGVLQSSPGLGTITVLPENDPPATQDDAATTPFNTAIAIAVLANDTDSEGDALTAVVRTGPAHGTAVAQADGSVLYTPNAGFRGTDSFEYSAFDGVTLSIRTPVSITVEPPPNVAPIARPDGAVTNEDTAVSIDVLANDTPGDDDLLTITIVDVTGKGSAVVLADGRIHFTPNQDENGFTTITYRLDDGQATSDAVVTVAIAPVPDAPVAYNDFFGVLHATPTVLDPLFYDYDGDGDALVFTLVSGPLHGSFTPTGAGTFLYTPDADYSGEDTVLYSLSDGALSSGIARITIQVAAAINTPPAAQDGTATTVEDTVLNDTLVFLVQDVDRDPLTYSVVEGPAHGTLVLNATTGAYVYTPNADYFGPDSFRYGASDGDVRADATVRITVTSDNDAPVVANDAASTATDTPVEVDVLANDYDPEGGALSLLITSAPQGGNAVVTENGLIRFTPAPDFEGATSLTYRATDAEGGQAEGALLITVVAPPNQPPSATDQSATIDEDTPLSGNLLDYASDPEGKKLAPRLTALPEHGLLAFESDTGKFTYTPAADFNGTDNFSFAVKDPKGAEAFATVAITITAVNDAPQARPDQAETPEETATSGNVLVNDRDADGQALSAYLAPGTATDTQLGVLSFAPDGAWSFVPVPDTNGTVVFTYFASDGATATSTTLTVVVGAVNDAPVATDAVATTNEDTVASGTLTATDIEGDALSFALAGGASSVTTALGTLTLSTSGSWVFTPAADASGSEDFSFTVSDGDLTDTGTLSMMVSPVNDVPLAENAGASTAEDTATSGTLAATDIDSDALAFTLAGGTSSVTTALGTLTLSAIGTWVFTPAPDATGSADFTFTVSDGDLTDNGTLAITVTPVNDAPVASNASLTTEEDTPVEGNLLALLSAADFDGGPLQIVSVAPTLLGVFSVNNATGDFRFTPNSNQNGLGNVDVIISDGTAQITANLSLDVTPVNDAPIAGNGAATTQEDTPVIIDLRDLITDIDSVNVRALIDVGSAVHGRLEFSLDGLGITYHPSPNYFGPDSFSYSVADRTLTGTGTISVTVTPVNDAPVASNASAATAANTPIAGIVQAIDIDGPALSFALAQGQNASTPLGTLAFGADGTWSFAPATDASGTVVYTFIASDGTLNDDATLSITVAPPGVEVNAAPIANPDSATVNEAAPTDLLVLANDTDGNSDAITIIDITVQPIFGTAAIVGGALVYTANDGSGGQQDFLRYLISDGQGGTAEGDVTIDILDVNTPPVAEPDTATTDEDTAVAVAVLANDSDDGTTPLAVGITVGPAHGSATVEGGAIRYVPAADYFGTDTLTYSITDDAGQVATATLDIAVNAMNDAPLAGDDTANTAYNTAILLPIAALLGNDSDPEGAALAITGVSDAVGGTATLQGNAILFTPDAGFSGPGGFSYTLSDGGLTNLADVLVMVGAPPPAGTAQFRFGDGAAGTPLGSSPSAPYAGTAAITRLVDLTEAADGDTDVVMKGNWNALKNIELGFTDGPAAGSFTVQNFVALFADFTGGTPETSPGIDFAAIGLKRGVASFGNGDDQVTWVAHSNGGERNGWSEQTRLETAGGADEVRLFTVASSTLDEAMLAGRGNGALWNKAYDGRFSTFTIDLGDGDDSLTSVATDKMRIDVKGGAGADTIITAAGSDRVDGGAGSDTLVGGGANDVFVLRIGQASGDRILDFTGAGAPGGDTLEFVGFSPGATVSALGGGLFQVAGSETFQLFNNGVGVTNLAAADYLFT
jgi:large repetitive protein